MDFQHLEDGDVLLLKDTSSLTTKAISAAQAISPMRRIPGGGRYNITHAGIYSSSGGFADAGRSVSINTGFIIEAAAGGLRSVPLRDKQGMRYLVYRFRSPTPPCTFWYVGSDEDRKETLNRTMSRSISKRAAEYAERTVKAREDVGGEYSKIQALVGIFGSARRGADAKAYAESLVLHPFKKRQFYCSQFVATAYEYASTEYHGNTSIAAINVDCRYVTPSALYGILNHSRDWENVGDLTI